MKNSTILTMTTVIVAVILTTSILIPVIQNAQNEGVKKTISLSNEGESLIEGDVSESYDFQWDSALPGTIKINNPTPTVYFVPGTGGTVSPESKTVVEDLTYGDLPTPVKTGYTFDGWYTSEQYTQEITSEDIVTSSSDVILYAKWTANEYTVTFDADGGTVSPATKTVTYDSAYGELPVPTYTGHIFGGWFDSNNNPITSLTTVSIASDHTLTAVWTLEQYLVSFTTDGHGTVDTQSMLVDYGTAYTILNNTITIGSTTITATPSSGWVWNQWIPSTSGTITEATTFTATFDQPIPATLTFTAQSPGSVDTASLDVVVGTQYVVTDNVVTVVGYGSVTATLVNGYYFTGWNIAQGSGIVSDSMTFTARYELIEIAKVATSDYTAWVVTTDGKLFGCGNNGYGQQGDGTTNNVTTFTQRLANETVASVNTYDGDATWVITTDGKLFGCGNNGYGQQGDGTTNNVTTFTQRLANETVASVHRNSSVTWVLTTDGKLFGCGRNNYGQQGDGSTTDVTSFTQRLANKTIASVYPSYNLTWAVTTDGKLFGCGVNNNGQQGDGTTTTVTTFTQRLPTETVASVSSNGSVTWVVTTDGKLFGCGYNSAGQQGNGTMNNVTSFTQRLTTETVASVLGNSSATWVITTDGKLFGCGAGDSGQQGSGNTSNVTSFTQRLTDETVASVSCVGSSTWAITTDGKLFGCGKGNNGQQGSGSTSKVTTFTQRLTNETISSVLSTDVLTWAITTDGKLFGCGRNNYGQQGDGSTANVTTFTQRLANETVASIYFVSTTTWVFTTDGKLFGCGYNGYGQQGNGSTANVTSFTQDGPAVINITPSLSASLQSIHPLINSTPLSPSIISPLYSQNITVSNQTDYIFHAGGDNWMLCTVTTDQDQQVLALYSDDLNEPLIWDEDVILTFSNGTMTIEKDGTTYEIHYDSIFYKGPNGKYVLMGNTAYVVDSTAVRGYAILDSGALGACGSVSSLETVDMTDGTITPGDATATTEDSEYEGAMLLSGISIAYDSDGTAACTSIIVPKNVTATTTVEDTTLMPLLWVVPIVVLAAIVLFIVRSMMNRND